MAAAFSGQSFGWTGDQTGLPDLGTSVSGDSAGIDSKDGSDSVTYENTSASTSRLDLGNNSKAILSWNSFSIDTSKTLQVLGDSDFILLNKVTGSAASTITGAISTLGANATVILVNPNGITISDGASLDITNLMLSSQATTLSAATSLSTVSVSNFGLTFGDLDGTSATKDIAINENFTLSGDIVLLADGAVSVADSSTTGNLSAANIYITTDSGDVTASGNSTLSASGTLTIDTDSTGAGGAAIDVKTSATELKDVDAGVADITITASGAITQNAGSTIKGDNVIIATGSRVGSSSNALRINATDVSVYGTAGTGNATGDDIYILPVTSSLAVKELNAGSGSVYISGSQAITDGGITDITAATLTISNTVGNSSAQTLETVIDTAMSKED